MLHKYLSLYACSKAFGEEDDTDIKIQLMTTKQKLNFCLLYSFSNLKKFFKNFTIFCISKEVKVLSKGECKRGEFGQKKNWS